MEEQQAGWEYLSFSFGNGEKIMTQAEWLSLLPLRADLMYDPRVLAWPGTASARYFGDRQWLQYGAAPVADVYVPRAAIQEVTQEGKDICEVMAFYQKLADEAAAAYTAEPSCWYWQEERTNYKYADEFHEPEILTSCPPA